MKRNQFMRWRVMTILFALFIPFAIAVGCGGSDEAPFCLDDTCKKGAGEGGAQPDGGDACEATCAPGTVCDQNTGKCEPPGKLPCDGHCGPTTHCDPVTNTCVPGPGDPCEGKCAPGTTCNTGTGKCEAPGGGDPCKGHCDPPATVCDPNTKQCVPGTGGEGGAGGDGGGLPCGGHCGSGTHCSGGVCVADDAGTGGDGGGGGDSGSCNPVTDPCSCACSGGTVCDVVHKKCMSGACDGLNDAAEGWNVEGILVGAACTNHKKGDCFAVGTVACFSATEAYCNAPVIGPKAEVCDGHDNNCNGLVDDGLSICSCTPTTEVCGNLKDDDCDGIVDNDCCPGPNCPSELPPGGDGGAGGSGGSGGDSGSGGSGGGDAGSCNPLTDPCACFCSAGTVCNAVTKLCEMPGASCVNGSTTICGSSVGTCKTGIQTCSGGVWGPCVGSVGPSAEVCDGKDNNCNGMPDDGLVGCFCTPGQTAVCGKNVGECKQGVTTCTGGGTWGACVGSVGPVAESCDGKDNDCNGSIDDGAGCVCTNGSTMPCGSSVGECRQGVTTCSGGAWGACVGAVGPTSESCDGKDNNCNGLTDEGLSACVCTPGQTAVCGTNIGECKTGLMTCTGGGTWGACVGSVGPAAEVCDGKDNNCNGMPDDAIVCSCINGSTAPCGSNIGQCKQGITTCSGGAWGVCVGAVGPSPETCNGLDDDCNGSIDDGLIACICLNGSTTVCGSNVGECKQGISTCASNTWGPCVGGVTPIAEVCDGKDNNCNGLNDDAIICSCVNGSTQTCGSSVGTCKTGVQTCSGGAWGVCVGAVGPSTETCNGLDDNCNGLPDDGISCVCINGTTTVCGSNVGECKQGTSTCVGGVWGACVGGVGPVAEVCDGKDNDCNGVNDNGISCTCINGSTQTCGSSTGICKPGTQTCVSNAWGPCVGGVGPGTETCNGLDDNCNGSIDDGITCTCINGTTQACGSNVGECKKGTQTCSGGAWGVCVGEVGPSGEICDGKDNDCNGAIDDLISCACINGTTKACGSSVGECVQGISTCSSGAWGSCVGEVTPTAEICDGKDNDCNGFTDDGLSCVDAGPPPDAGASNITFDTLAMACFKAVIIDDATKMVVWGSASPDTCPTELAGIDLPDTAHTLIVWVKDPLNNLLAFNSLVGPFAVTKARCSVYATAPTWAQLQSDYLLSFSTVTSSSVPPGYVFTKSCANSAEYWIHR